MRLFERVEDLLKVRVAAFAVADVLTEVYCATIQLMQFAILLSSIDFCIGGQDFNEGQGKERGRHL